MVITSDPIISESSLFTAVMLVYLLCIYQEKFETKLHELSLWDCVRAAPIGTVVLSIENMKEEYTDS